MVKVDARDFVRDLKIIEQRLIEAAHAGLTKAVKVAWRTAHDTTLFEDQTGELRGTIDIVDLGHSRAQFKQRLIWRAKHAHYLTEGTKDHGPKHAKSMRFQIGGRWINTRFVKGVKKRPFDVHAALAGALEMTIVMNEGANSAVKYP